uniref:Probable calcium-binding protein CML30 n=1 Tax=Nicotiana tabacum TaxID=4097 RepID=A0A1S3YDL7_TOBAC|nr:PREDICTED: probable calcium-binding protein CML30 [Nicotiana tabacum]
MTKGRYIVRTSFLIVLSSGRGRLNLDLYSLKNSNCGHENLDNEDLQKEDVEVVIMDRLMNFCNQNGDRIEDIKPELAEVLSLFEEVEPSFEEIKEAFDMFDENGDGYIDASELMKIIGRMGFSEFSVEDCKKMIMAFDENKNGRIEFREFVKLIEQSFREPDQS